MRAARSLLAGMAVVALAAPSAWTAGPPSELLYVTGAMLRRSAEHLHRASGSAARHPEEAGAAAETGKRSGTLPPGARISLSLKDADLGDVLRSFAQLAGFDLVLDPSVRGAVTVELHDVPWEQALAVILRSHGLAAELDGTAWQVAPK